jgi:serine/threonine protein kinase
MLHEAETPRDLLFGLLALQNGLIDQDQLVTAFSAPSRAKERTLAEILVESGSIATEGCSLLAAMTELQLRLHGGDTEKSLAAVTVGPSTREKLTALGDADLTASVALVGSHTQLTDATASMPIGTSDATVPTSADKSDNAASISIGTSTSNGLRFRVLRPHAQGGLGAVFVALDDELNREVALKQILDRHADDPSCRTRFLIEAEITGGLEHPGIVPVYGLGHYGNGRPYYAMRFIRGQSLKETIAAVHADEAQKGNSLALRKLLRRFVDVCNAIDYAHGRGVLHRDLKPANVIVGNHGETLVVDWGLAKLLERPETDSPSQERALLPSSSGGSADTRPGSVIGTPAFMSPEQAHGDLDRLGPRSDVYSLGATLYSVLTGTVAFEKGDLATMIQAVQGGDFPPPRQRDPTIDPALEAVCLKAMALKPEDRYGSARALADDVERWMADEPVSAWREPWSRRARRWMRRHRTAMTTVSAAVLVAVAGLASVLAVQARANRELLGKNAELADANRRVQARFELAHDAIRAFQAGVNEDEMLKDAALEGLRNKLLRSAAGFYERLEKLLEGQTDRASRSILAQSFDELGDLIAKIGVRPEALAAHRKALAIRRELAASGVDERTRLDMVQSLLIVGNLAEQTGDLSGARAALDEALGLAEATAAVFASDDTRAMLAKCHTGLGTMQGHQNQTALALESFNRALAMFEALARDNPGVTRFRADVAANEASIGVAQMRTNRFTEALAAFGVARDSFEALAKANPTDTRFQSELARTYGSLGDAQRQIGRPDEALASQLRARSIRETLAKANPAVTSFQSDLANAEATVASIQLDTGRTADALASFGQSLAIHRALAKANPAVIHLQQNEAGALNELSWAQSRIGRSAEALATALQEVKIRETLANANPSIANLQHGLGTSYLNLGQLQYESGDAKAGLGSSRLGLEALEKAARVDPTDHRNRVALAVAHINVGANLSRLDPRGAREAFDRALSLFEELVRENPAVTEHQDGVGMAALNLGQVHQMMRNQKEAHDSFSRAVQAFETLATLNPTITHYQAKLAESLTILASGHREAGRLSEASASVVRARSILERLAELNPNDPELRQVLVPWLQISALIASDAGRYAESAAFYRRLIAILSALPEAVPSLYDLTCARSRLAGLAIHPGSGIAAEEGQAEADRAVATFAKAIRAGYSNLAQCRTDSDLSAIRSRPDFQLLMMDIAFPIRSFATDFAPPMPVRH